MSNQSRNLLIYSAIVITGGIALFFLLRDEKQTIASTVLLSTVMGTLMFWEFRVAMAFIGLSVLLLTGTIDVGQAIEFMQLNVILFLIGTMVIIGLLRRSGFLRWVLVKGLIFSRFNPTMLLVILLTLSSTIAALIDEVSAILFTSALLFDLSDHFRVNPTKYLISSVLATNIGSTWTVLGNPVGILIALDSGLTIGSFLSFSLPVGIVSLIIMMVVLYFWQRKELGELGRKAVHEFAGGNPGEAARFNLHDSGSSPFIEWAEIKDKRLFTGSIIIFAVFILMIAFGTQIENLLKIERETTLLVAPILAAAIVLIWQREHAQEYIQKDVDWWTLVFFMFLFAEAGALTQVGIADKISAGMLSLTATGSRATLVLLLEWASGALSSLLDNVVVVAALSPVAQVLSTALKTTAPWWALLFGGCYGGNLTQVGSTANIVAMGELEKRKGIRIKAALWLQAGLFATILPMIIGTLALLLIR